MGDFKDTTLAGDDYTYDINGNISKDFNRHMHTKTNGNGAVYNLLDKPDSICIAGRSATYYYYDGGGTRLRKQINDYSTGSLIVKNYLYLNGFVYMNDTLQYVQQEEGRIRWAKKRDNQSGSIYFAYEYDYFLKDHLGNVRAVLTEGKDTATYAATMESADSAKVQALFSNVYDPVRTVTAKPSAFDTDNTNHYVSKLTGNSVSAGQGGRTGPSLILKVMAGDKVQINTYAYFNTAVQPPVSDNTLLIDLLTTLVSGVTAQSSGKIGLGNAAAVSSSISPNELAALNTRGYNPALPKAYLNWVLFDDQFKYVAGNMGGVQVIAGASKQALVAPLQTMAKNGYLFVYVSNQSPQDVYFDDLIVTHTTGPLVQEQSYYPFGLQMAGISDKAVNKLTSQDKFNSGSELEDETGYYNTSYRKYDAQIGRFAGIDILAGKFASMNPYQFGYNNPITYNDPSGAQNNGAPQHVGGIQMGDGIWIGGEDYAENGPTPDAGGTMQSGTMSGGGGDYSGFWSRVVNPIMGMVGNYGDLNAHFDQGFDVRGNSVMNINFSYSFNNGFGSRNDEVVEGTMTVKNYESASPNSNKLENANHTNDGFGGLASGFGYSTSSFRLTNGSYNGSEFSFKYYSSGWAGGSRARISTYKIAGLGEGLAKVSIITSVALGAVDVYMGYEEDGESYGTNAEKATGSAVGSVVGGWAGAEGGAIIGASVGAWFGGVGAVPGAIIGGIFGGILGGWSGSETGENMVEDMQ